MRDLDGDGIAQDLVDEGADFLGHGGGKQQDLAFRRQALEDLADVWQEAHVEHAVGLVEHEAFDVVEIEFALAEQVEQAAGTGDGELRALANAGDLRLLAHAAVDGDAAQAHVLAQLGDDVLRLLGQFARGADDQRAQLVPRPGHQAVEEGQDERGGFAGAGLGQTHDVAPFQNGRDGLLLDGSGDDVALLGDVLQQARVEAQRLEAHGESPGGEGRKVVFATPSARKSTCAAAHRARRADGPYGIGVRKSSAAVSRRRRGRRRRRVD